MNIVLFLSAPLDMEPLYKGPVPVELIDAGGRSLYEKNYAAWKKHFPDSPLFVIDPSGNRVFSELCGNSDTLNIPSTGLFSKIFIFSAFACSFSLSPLSLFAPAYLDPEALPGLCIQAGEFLNTPLGSETIAFFTSAERPSPLSIELGERVFRSSFSEIFSIKNFLPRPDKAPAGSFLPASSVFTLNSYRFKEYLSGDDAELHELFIELEKCWKNKASLKAFLRDSAGRLNSIRFEDVISGMEEKLAVDTALMPAEIDTPARLLGILDRDQRGNFVEGAAELSNVSGCLIINRSEKRLVLSNIADSFVLASGEGTRVESF